MIEHLTATDLGRAAWRHPGHRRASYLLHSVLSTLILSDLLISLYHLLFVSVQISHSRPACELCVSKNVIMPSLSSLHSSLHQSLWRLFTAAWLWVVSCLLSPVPCCLEPELSCYDNRLRYVFLTPGSATLFAGTAPLQIFSCHTSGESAVAGISDFVSISQCSR